MSKIPKQCKSREHHSAGKVHPSRKARTVKKKIEKKKKKGKRASSIASRVGGEDQLTTTSANNTSSIKLEKREKSVYQNS